MTPDSGEQGADEQGLEEQGLDEQGSGTEETTPSRNRRLGIRNLRPRNLRARPRLGLGVLAAVLALACGYVAVGVHLVPAIVPASWTAPQRTVDREADVIAAAREVTNALFNTDYKTIDANNKRVLELTTGEFATQFADAQVEVAAAFRAEQVVRKVSILKIGVGQLTDSTAIVSVAADTALTGVVTQKDKNGAGTPKPVNGTAPYRWELTMKKIGDRWLLEKLEFVV